MQELKTETVLEDTLTHHQLTLEMNEVHISESWLCNGEFSKLTCMQNTFFPRG